MALQRIIGVQPAWMRPPYGSLNDQVVAAANARGQNGASCLYVLILLSLTKLHLPVALWDFDSGDADGTPADQSKNMYSDTSNQHPSTLLALNHETQTSTPYAPISDSKPCAGTHRPSPLPNRSDVLPFAIDVLQRAGYDLVTLAECVGQNPYQWVRSPQTPGVCFIFS